MYDAREKARRDRLWILDTARYERLEGHIEGRKEGFVAGREEGLKEAREEAREEGREEGQADALIKMIQDLQATFGLKVTPISELQVLNLDALNQVWDKTLKEVKPLN